LEPLYRLSIPATLEITGENQDGSHITVITIINMKLVRLTHLLFLSGMVVGLTMASPSLAMPTPNGTKSSATEAVKGTINDLIPTPR
jgi:hypothetical protein